ncbi:MAG: hypothetical protein EOQ64_17575 [Mesorhizobium sp.]|nr:MAG: hypothetical protein EOQ64_17575 [Mesorhizobium sp.]RWH16038.1 MAG: hypothetical protein EOQ76_31445 [Mesorhizobium sp.]RWH33896.1 MAG: hypothetical protein EOQ79_27510 [Mesorhizobium sp.]RWH46282.1 MAG: hypothetical protein EOQ78_04055 [Mesorhizobium sp.]RWI24955.1 MAG: hypothetical protein EOQ94_04630 [Mesorhizobium sp.]
MAAGSPTFVIGRNTSRIVILWRSKERSDAAQTIESIPLPISVAAVQNSARRHSSTKVTAWILGSWRPLRSRSARG